MKLSLLGASPELAAGAAEVGPLLGLEFGEDGLPVRLAPGADGLSVRLADGRATLGFSRRCEFYRGLGLLSEHAGERNFSVTETRAYQSLGAMFDCSRNGVLTPDAIRRMLRYMAVMGFDTLMLYIEDLYEVPGFPYFGHLRGRYTAQELRACDRYAERLGIELVPCIQTLAHLQTAFKWAQFQKIRDCDDILLAGDERTYALIDAMLGALAGLFRSRRVNIGMDEAHMVGLGRYLDAHGYQPRFDILKNHLSRVLALCRKHGFHAQMWSDMFYRLLGGGYYDTAGPLDPALLKQVPADVDLVYWDYYSDSRAQYDRRLESHLKFGNEIVFAGGGWKWTGFAPGNQWSFLTSRMALESCRAHGIRQVFVTGWGDDGAECSSFATLPVLQLFAEDCYEQNTSDEFLRTRFQTCARGSLDDFLGLDRPNLLPGNDAPGGCSVNPSKYLFYQDVLLGLFDAHTKIGAYNGYYGTLADEFSLAAARNADFADVFETEAAFCRVLELKCDIGLRLRGAYAAGDRAALRQLAVGELSRLLDRLETFHEVFRRQWARENKPFGFEVQDIRLGGLKERVRAAQRRVLGYLNGSCARLEELEQPVLDYACRPAEKAAAHPHLSMNVWNSIVTPNNL